MTQQRVPYGLWPSPISPEKLASETRLRELSWNDDGKTLVWLEGRSGQGMLMADDGSGDAPRGITPAVNVRARVGYGGGDFSVADDAAFYVSEGRLYRQPLGAGQPQAITPDQGQAAAPTLSPDRRWVLYVHSAEEKDCLAIVDAQGQLWPRKVVEGADFYMQPAWHPDGRQMAWIAWDHPQMPWDGTRLELGELAGASPGPPYLANKRVLCGGPETSIFQPSFSPDGRWLAYVSDREGWYDLYLHDLAGGDTRRLVAEEAELGVPAWAQGMRTYAWAPDSQRIYYVSSKAGIASLKCVTIDDGTTRTLAGLEDYSSFSQPAMSAEGRLAVLASGPRVPRRVIVLDVNDEGACAGRNIATRVAARSASETLPKELMSEAEAIQWSSDEGETVHGLLYLPRSERFSSSGRPPVVVSVHGGPTGQATAGYSNATQFFTTRGYAVLDVNYRGSSGYGRRYRNLLREKWGLYDADDSVAGARYLAEKGLVDGDRMVIMGGSAGGFTVLQSLIRHPGVFKAGICMYGVTNLFTLAADTHKFEQRYLDSMVGPLPEAAERYRENSPIFAADRIRDPVAVFQGEDDRVVPKEQADTVVEALERSGVPHEYHVYPGEGHGWRKTETIESFYETVERFLRQYVLFS